MFNIQAINQVGIVVRDVDKAVEYYWQKFGIGPWQIMTFGPGSKKLTYYGEPCSFVLRIALAQVGPLMLELLEPVSGPTPHQDFLEQHGEGVQHLGIFVERLDQAAEMMYKLGYKEISGAYGFGTKGDGAAAYFGTDDQLGTLLELIEMPAEMPPAEKIYPDPGE